MDTIKLSDGGHVYPLNWDGDLATIDGDVHEFVECVRCKDYFCIHNGHGYDYKTNQCENSQEELPGLSYEEFDGTDIEPQLI